MIKKGVNFVEGFKAYKMNQQVTEHPTLWFYDDENDKYYFFNLTSVNNNNFNENIHCFGETWYKRDVVYARNVRLNGKVFYVYEMYMVSTCAVVDGKYVSSPNKVNHEAAVRINDNYDCSKKYELYSQLFTIIYNRTDDIVCYNANCHFDFSFENEDLEDTLLPQKIFDYIEDSLN